MGASSFVTTAAGVTAKQAFQTAIEEARLAYGNRGYTGSIAEKRDFVMIAAPTDQTPMDYANKLLSDDDDRIASKVGPAGCIALSDQQYLFFGFARS